MSVGAPALHDRGVASVTLPAAVLDDFIASYVCWREACDAVAHAYSRWCVAAAGERDLAFAAYHAALDREGHASDVHRDVQRRLGAEYAWAAGGTGERFPRWSPA